VGVEEHKASKRQPVNAAAECRKTQPEVECARTGGIEAAETSHKTEKVDTAPTESRHVDIEEGPADRSCCRGECSHCIPAQ
jgi:hypothetical protein